MWQSHVVAHYVLEGPMREVFSAAIRLASNNVGQPECIGKGRKLKPWAYVRGSLGSHPDSFR